MRCSIVQHTANVECCKIFKCSWLIWCIFLKFIIEVSVEHDSWVSFKSHFNCTLFVTAISNVHSRFLLSWIVRHKIFEQWKINSFVEWMVFWSKINNSKLPSLLLHFCDNCAGSFGCFSMVMFYYLIINTFSSSTSFIDFEEISISKNTKMIEQTSTLTWKRQKLGTFKSDIHAEVSCFHQH